MTAATDRRLLDIPQVCERLGGISRTTVYALAKAGELTKVNIGKRGFITADSCDSYVSRLTGAQD